MDHDTWQWQQPDTVWKGAGLYHVTMVVPSRQPLFGELVIPNDDPLQAFVKRTDLGNAVVDRLLRVPEFYPEVQVLHFCLMPNHLHAILYVRRAMKKGISSVITGFWRAARTLGRAYSYLSSTVTPADDHYYTNPALLRAQVGNDAFYALSPVFTDQPFLRPMSQYRQLPTAIRYLDMNPARLATKRLKPGFFCVQHNVEINGRTYDAVGNIGVLMEQFRKPVHVRSMWVKDAAEHGYDQPLKEYKAVCLDAASKGTVMVSPFISRDEQEVLHALLRDNRYIIYLSDNGFGNYFKPSDLLFDAVAAGRLLILSPWMHDPDKRTITRAECVALNQMAEEISASH
jgi:REP element-mobilizing transposase RayT